MNLLIKFIVDIILGPFLWLSARKLRKSDEWRDTMTKVKELTKKSEALTAKAHKAYEDYQLMQAEKLKNKK